uniref:Uncharacterized protein n=1 Tax=Physcomitrium patens TaxID=3218 RepID=A0A2K1KAS4_PHYPA|nr:hypothetical protein PHYPA_010063 [Physcomitrium patens]
MVINKGQGQTIGIISMHLHDLIFIHDVFVCYTKEKSKKSTTNIVYCTNDSVASYSYQVIIE